MLEASPTNFETLKINRPDELALVHSGICAEESDLHWMEGKYGATGAFWEFASEYHRWRWLKGNSPNQGTLVKCRSLSKIIEERLGSNTFFDFWTLDIEGAEFTALQTVDFEKVAFGMIVVEASNQNMMKDMAVRTLLESKGYRHLQIEGMKGNYDSDVFVNKNWHDIYKHLVHV